MDSCTVEMRHVIYHWQHYNSMYDTPSLFAFVFYLWATLCPLFTTTAQGYGKLCERQILLSTKYHLSNWSYLLVFIHNCLTFTVLCCWCTNSTLPLTFNNRLSIVKHWQECPGRLQLHEIKHQAKWMNQMPALCQFDTRQLLLIKTWGHNSLFTSASYKIDRNVWYGKDRTQMTSQYSIALLAFTRVGSA